MKNCDYCEGKDYSPKASNLDKLVTIEFITSSSTDSFTRFESESTKFFLLQLLFSLSISDFLLKTHPISYLPHESDVTSLYVFSLTRVNPSL